MSDIAVVGGVSENIVGIVNGNGPLHTLNAAAQLAATATSLTIPLSPGQAVAALTANEGALSTGTAAFVADVQAGNGLDAMGDAISVVGDGINIAAAIAAQQGPAGQALAADMAAWGDTVTLLGLGITDGSAVINGTPIAASELETEINENLTNIQATGNSATPFFVTVNGNAGTAWGNFETGLVDALTDLETAAVATGNAFTNAINAVSNDLSTATTGLTNLFNNTGATDANITDTVTNDDVCTIASSGNPSISGSLSVSAGATDSGATGYNGGNSITQDETFGSDGSITNTTQSLNPNGSTQYTLIITTGADGQISATITGTGDVTALSNASITMATGAQATITGSDNTPGVGDDQALTVNGNNYSMNAASGGDGGSMTVETADGGSVAFDSGTYGSISTNNGSTSVAVTGEGGNDLGEIDIDSNTGKAVMISPNGDVTDLGNITNMQVTNDPDGGVDTTVDFPGGGSATTHTDPDGNTSTTSGSIPDDPSQPNPGGDGSGSDGSGGPGTSDGSFAGPVGGSFNNSMIDPIVLDMSGDNAGVQLTSLADSSAYFDLTGDGFASHTGWVGPTTGILVDTSDPTSIADLFGSASESGFAALQALAGSGNTTINSSTPGWNNLYVWQDANGNGVADAGEVQSLTSLGITSISLETTPVNEMVNGNEIGEVATFTYSNGTTGQVAEAYFNNSQLDSQYSGSYTLNPEALVLPNLRGYGTLPPLYIALSLDPTLLGMVQNFTNQGISDLSNVAAQVTAILYEWAGVENVSPTSRGAYFNAQELGVLEAFNGESFTSYTGGVSSNPTSTHEGETLDSAWNTLLSAMETRLLVQGPLAQVFPGVQYDYNTDSLTGSMNLTSVADAIAANTPTGAFQAGQYWEQMLAVTSAVATALGVSGSSVTSALQTAFNALSLPFTFAEVEAGDTIVGYGSGNAVTAVDSYSPEALVLASNVASSDVILQADNSGDLTVKLQDTGDSVTLKGDLTYWNGSNASEGVSSIDNISSVTPYEYGGYYPVFTWVGTSGDTVLTGSSYGDNVFDLGPGNDTVTAGPSRTNTFNFDKGDGQATVNLNGSAVQSGTLNLGADIAPSDVILQTDASADLTVKLLDTGESITFQNDLTYWNGVNGSEGAHSVVKQINFGNGTSLALDSSYPTFTYIGTSTYTNLVGGSYGGSSIFNLGPGNDTVTAGAYGTNVFNFDKGDGQATVNLNGSGNNSGTLYLGSDISESDVLVQADNSGDLTVKLVDTGESITFASDLSYWNGSNFNDGDNSVVNDIVFDNGDPTIVMGASYPTFTWIGSSTDTTLTGSSYGSNVFDLGSGNDTATAGNGGTNTYNFGRGDGQDIINDYHTDSSTSVLDFGPGVSPSDVVLTQDGENLVAAIAGTATQVTVENYFEGADYQITDIDFSDGTQWNDATIASSLTASQTLADGTTLNLTTNGNIVFGGNDNTLTLSGSSSNRVTYTGSGNSVADDSSSSENVAMDAAAGSDNNFIFNGTNDTAILNGGSDQGILYGGSNAVTINGNSGTVSDLSTNSGNTITLAGNSDTATLSGTYDSATVSGNDDTADLYGAHGTLEIDGTDGTATIGGGNSTATVTGSGNAVSLTAANNTLSDTSAASGNTFNIHADSDTVTLNGSNETANVYNGSDTVTLAGTSDTAWDFGTGSSTFTVSGTDSKAYLFSNGSTATVTGSDNALQLAGELDSATFSANNGTVTLYGYLENATISGAGDTVDNDGAAASVTLDGTDGALTLSGEYNSGTLSGTSDSATVSGSSDALTVGEANSTITLTGTSDTATLNGNGATLTDSGTNDTTDVYGTGANVAVSGSGGTVFDYGNNGTFGVSGNGFANLSGSDSSVTVSGDGGFSLSGSNDTGALSGNSATGTTYGYDETVTVTGNSDSFTDDGVINAVTASGASDNLTLAGEYSTATLSGNSGTVTLGGTSNSLLLSGGSTGDTINLNGTSVLAEITGTSSDAITFGSSATGTLKLDAPTGFSGTVAGLAGSDGIDLAGFLFSGTPTISSVTGSGASGTDTDVTITDGSQSATLALLNQYANQYAVNASAYALSADSIPGTPGTLFQLAAGH